MSMHRLSAGSGFRYLLRHTACGDVQRSAAEPLTAYYAAHGYPAGRWMGAGLVGLGDDLGIRPGAVVTEEAMGALFGQGRDPLTDAPLGRPYPTFKPVAERVAARIAALPAGLTEEARAAQVASIERFEGRRPVPHAVAGYDLTFTVPKSVSVLWALADPGTQAAIADAHAAAVAGALAWLEAEALFTRTGHGGLEQVQARGAVATAFDHWDSRSGDPNLHTHLVVANRVQGPDGAWRSVDGRTIHHATVAVSELYDGLLADHLASALPVTFGFRDRGARRTPAYEIDGIDDALLAEFSTRSAAIGDALDDAMEAFRAGHGRSPSRAENLRLRQVATRATRPPKTPRPLPELMAIWRNRAEALTGQSPAALTAAIRSGQQPAGVGVGDFDAATLDGLAEIVLTGVEQRRATWNRWNLHAEAARATRDLRLVGDRAREQLNAAVVAAAEARCLVLEPGPEVRRGETRMSTPAMLLAEQHLLDASVDGAAPSLPARVTDVIVDAMTGRGQLSTDQAAALRGIAGSTNTVQVLVGPAGSGKTTVLATLRGLWRREYGQPAVLALASSATAAAQLGKALGVRADTLAKWLHESEGPGAEQRLEGLAAAQMQARTPRDSRFATGQWASDVHAQRLLAEQLAWTLKPGQLVIVDEASLAGTLALSSLTAQAQHAGARVLLVGDDHQLGAVEAGGVFGLLAGRPGAQELTALWRFENRWEAQATRALRVGNPAALDYYTAHDRIHDGPRQDMIDAAYTAWQNAEHDGRLAVLAAPDNTTVTELNARAHRDRVTEGHVTGDQLALADGLDAGVGDRVVTRRNNRRLRTDHGYVHNGDLWTIAHVNPDGSLLVVPEPSHHTDHDNGDDTTKGTAPAPVRLPARYVRDHVELGYATTIHRAQGITTDETHLVVGPDTTREALYVGISRGRAANHVYVTTDTPTDNDEHPYPSGPPNTGREILEQILATSGRELSATETWHQARPPGNHTTETWQRLLAGLRPQASNRPQNAPTQLTSRYPTRPDGRAIGD
jgi:conjugative relaxase-like TrwC/TraI family protein